MKLVSEEMYELGSKRSAIRELFEYGKKRAEVVGAENVYDFSLGNPDVPPPAKTRDELIRLAETAVRPLGLGYCPNAGIPSVRETMAAYLSRQSGGRWYKPSFLATPPGLSSW